MRRSSLIVAAIVLVSTLFLGLTLLPDVRATTLYVGGAGPGNYTAIQTAVDDANPGDTVYVYSGTYRETTIINKTVSLVGEDQTVTVVDGNGTADVIHVSSDWVNVTGFTIMNGGRFTGNSGIELQSVQHCHIASNTLLNNSFGIRLLSSANNSIAQNSAFNSSNGIRLESSSNNTIINNNASLNQFIGIYLIESNDNSVIENTAFGNIGPGIAVEESINNIIEANNALHNDHGIRLSRSSDNLVANNTLSSNIFTGIRVYSSSDVTIQNNTIVNDPTVTERFLGVESYNSNSLTITGNVMVKSGIFIRGMTVWEWNTHSIGTSNTVNGKPVHYWKDAVGGTVPAGAGQVILANCVNVVVTGQNTSDGSVGIQLGFSSDNTISDNEASSNSYAGIYARETTRNVFDNNTLLSNGMEGIYLLDAKMSMITNNTVNYNSRGIQLSGSSNNTVTDNTASLNEGSGILLASSRENSLVGNTVSSNNYTGIVVHTSENNTFTRNTVSGNVRGIDLYYSIGDIFVNNTLVGNGFYLQGDSVEYWNSHDIESTNTVNGRPVYYWKDALGGTVPSGAGQVLLANCNGTAVENQNLSIASVGIEIGFSSHVTIFNVTASANTEGGISLYSSVDVAILNSTTTSNDAVGILLVSSVGITLSSNRMTGDGILLHGDLLQHWNTHTFNRSNRLNGKMVAYAKNLVGPEILPPIGQLILANCSQMTAKYLNLSDASAGIQMGFSSNNTILGNMISSNRWFGIRLYSSNDNVIVGNTISQTPWLGMSLISSSGNLIYHNNFIDNLAQAASEGLNPNEWDNGYPSGGNYWSDYPGLDEKSGPNQDQSGSDGIGDEPYSYWVNADRYPLMSPFEMEMVRPPTVLDAMLTGDGFENVTLGWIISPDDGNGLDSVVGYAVFRNTTYESGGGGYQLIALLPKGTSTYTDSSTGEGNPSAYFYLVCAFDVGNTTACTEYQAAKFTRPLAPGPNLISVPLAQSDESVETVLQTVEYDTVWYYDHFTREWNWYMKDKKYSGGLSGLNRTVGIWVNVTEASNLTVAGIVPAQTTIHLYEGWNLVSFPSVNATYTVADLKAETGATRVEGFDPAPPHFLRVLGDAEVLQAGYGYWVKVEADTIWTVSFA